MDLRTVLQVILSILLIALVLMQVRGTGLGKVWGQQTNYFSRRGVEDAMFKLTIVVVALFLIVVGSQLVL